VTSGPAPLTAPVDAVVLDYGGVLTGPVRASIEAWVAADGIDPAGLTRTLRAWLARHVEHGSPIHLLETGELPPEDFERRLAAELDTLDGMPVRAEGLLGRLFAALTTDEAMFALAEVLRERGVPVAILSNSWGDIYPRERLDALVDHVVISSEVGLRKPQAEIYRLTVERLGVEPARAVLVDDAEPNVLGARAAGLQALLHTDAATTRTALAAVLPFLHDPSTPTPTTRSTR
jgi:epoxide hydrolase-like predicted phosphatase